MRLLRVGIENFRNFESVECELGTHVVLLGENGSGKSNLLRALRLVLDPDMSDADRHLDAEDFWSGTVPFGGTEIKISIDLTDYDGEPAVLACLGDHEVAPPDGHLSPVARLTYRYAPRSTKDQGERSATTKEHYDFSIYGRDDSSNEVGRDVRRFLMFKLLPALRDAENDLRVWRRSPLRPLIEELVPSLDPAALAELVRDADQVTAGIATQAPLAELQKDIVGRVNEMIGQEHGLDPTLGFGSTDARLLLRSLKLFVDAGRRWDVSETSLGLANVVYLALLLLYVQRQEKSKQMASILLGIEEPEAHLHPQMQRRVFRDLLQGSRPVLVSTHSPNIASVAPVESIVVLRSDAKKSTLRSLANTAAFTEQQKHDLAHYLDVTRAEILFGRGIVLVEGDAERFVVPAAARIMDPPTELDEYGISVCSVSGTDFLPYARLLRQLDIPCVVVTDGDHRDGIAVGEAAGITRARDLLKALGDDTSSIEAAIAAAQIETVYEQLDAAGVFVGERTLEIDMVAAGAGPRMRAAYTDIRPQTEDKTLVPFSVTTDPTDALEDQIVGLITRPGIGKGRFAQRFSSSMVATDVPSHISEAIRSIVAQCKHA